MSSDNAVANTGVELPDLRSRLAAITSIKLPSLDEDQQRLALSWRAQARGIQLNTKMLTWLQTHAPRDNHALFSILEKIDQHCLATHTKPSTALINNIIDNISTHHPND